MAVLPVRLFGDPVLRTRADEVTAFGAELRVLVQDMLDTMDAEGGAGLAAPQVGVGLRVFVYDCNGVRGHLVNPRWEAVGDEMQTGSEGCLSIPDIRAETTRHRDVVASGVDRDGRPVRFEATGLLARCVQHESDHLDGVLFLSRLGRTERAAAMREIRESDWFGAAAGIGGR
ncbi:peptide deformylase [Rhodococcus sp. D2-41]|uniref:Peptide deformylase n=1 Tax=Speluncibacter jeojiensis TaxID=2710754 RepID=A0A9X4M0T1_9ACTN|nr:peptide deformylase [Rhodococcus sp. D2-41]MDG3011248.1 peptide deformylase [Rhodococcus sp. D2-41]MDG3015900.1 peptide deformylase [Corynebacteriales bacterium D3-21]